MDEDLSVFLMEKDQNQSLNLLRNIFDRRLKSDREIWLIDASTFQSVKNAKKNLNSLNLDIDDDVYICFKLKNGTFSIFQAYKRRDGYPIIMNSLGFWSLKHGLKLNDMGKWERRRDLTVSQHNRQHAASP